MSSTYAEILPLLAQAGAKQPDPQYDVWDLEAGGCLWPLNAWKGSGLSEGVKRDVLTVLVRGRLPVFFCQAGEPDPERAATWTEVGPGIWRLPEDVDPTALLTAPTLDYGNWQIVAAEQPPPTPLPDIIRAPASEVASFLRRFEIAVLVDSFYDDAMWRIALAQEVSSK